MKMQLLNYIQLENLQTLEYRDEGVYAELKPESKVKKRFAYKEAKMLHKEKEKERAAFNEDASATFNAGQL